MKKVLVSTTSFAVYNKKPLEMLEKAGLTVALNPYGKKLSESEIRDLSRDADFLIAGTEPLSRDVLESAGKLKIISRCGVGMDNIDLEAAGELGIKVFNTPDGPTLAVAELTVGLILNLLRKVQPMDSAIRNGKWYKQMGHLLQGKKVGILGFGRIGQKVGELLSAFGTDLAHCDIEPKACTFDCGEKRFEEILGWADIVTLHMALSSECNPVIGSRELNFMKKGSWLINASRGGVVDEDALYIAMKEGWIGGAALDVFEEEPYCGRLTELENIILTPHIGSYAKEARVEMEKQSVENLLKGLTD